MYITPVKFHPMSASIPDVCTKYLDEKDAIPLSMGYPQIQNFQKDVIKCLPEMLHTTVNLNDKLCVQTTFFDFGFFSSQEGYRTMLEKYEHSNVENITIGACVIYVFYDNTFLTRSCNVRN